MFSQNKLWSFYDNDCDYEFVLKFERVSRSLIDLQNFCERNYSIYFLIQGNELIEYNDSSYKLKAGDILIIKPETLIHKQYLDSETSYIELKFKIGEYSGVLEKMVLEIVSRFEPLISFIRVSPTHFISLIKKMDTFIKSSQENKEIYSLQLFLDIVLNLSYPDMINEYINDLDDSDDDLNLMEKMIQDVMAFINNNFSQKITTQTLASEFEISRPYLCHMFKLYTKMTIGEYLMDIRMAYAQDLLSHTDEKIISIAYLVGYESVSQFNKKFRMKYNMTPSQYRENQKK